MAKFEMTAPTSDAAVNKKMKDLLDDYVDSAAADGEDVLDIPHRKVVSGTSEGLMKSVKDFTVLEAMEAIHEHLGSEDCMDCSVDDEPSDVVNDDSLLEELNKLFTPILINQQFEKDISDQTNAEISNADALNERSIIVFDDEARMSQLISTCALLLAKKKNTEKWKIFQNAAAIKKQSKIDIQKEEYNDAKALAQKYLVKIATTSNSSVARDAANNLLPQTQH